MSARRSPVACVVLALSAAFVAAPAARAQSVFSHQIALKLPKGANGMQPELALAYAPGGGNGIVGVGWQLTGLAAITRVNYGSGIEYAGRDTYAHSQFGILVPQADGSYRSRSESFVRFVPAGVCGDGPCAWTAQHPSGARSEYGTTADSQVLVQGSASVRTWGVARVVDLFGNAYHVAYAPDAANGQFYPRTVTYTVAANLSTCRTVEFFYEPRTDVEAGYAQSAFEQTTQRLEWIKVSSGASCTTSGGAPVLAGALLRQYRLDYECGDGVAATCPGTKTGRSRLRQVTEYGSDGTNTLPAQTFGWQPGSGQLWGYWAPPVDFAGRQGGYSWDSGLQVADLDGDGKQDLIQGWYNYGSSYREAWLHSIGSGWVHAPAFAPPAEFTGRDGSAPGGWDSGLRLVDLDADGRPDLVQGWYNYGSAYRQAWINNGGHCSTRGCAWTPAPAYALPVDFTGRDGSAPGGWDSGVRFGDVNGDGRPDAIQAWYNWSGANQQNVWLNTGSGWQWSGAFALPAAHLRFSGRDSTTPWGWMDGLAVLDLNGDGRADLAYAFGTTRGAWLSDGNGWVASTGFAPPVAFAGYDSYNKYYDGGVRFADVNGDGKVDLLRGLGLEVQTYTEPPPPICSRCQPLGLPGEPSVSAWLDQALDQPLDASAGVATDDLGATSIGAPITTDAYTITVSVYRDAFLSTGKGWRSSAANAPPVTFVSRRKDTGLRVADVNGDGRADLVHGDGTSRSAWVSFGTGWTLDPEYAPPASFVGTTWDSGGLQVGDIDGDGTADYLQGIYIETMSTHQGYTKGGGYGADLLTRVANGSGGTIAVEYRAAPQLADVIQTTSPAAGIPNAAPQQLVTRVTTTDGRGGQYATSYTYRDPRVVTGPVSEQRNLAFGWVNIRDDQTGQSTRNYYFQNPGCEGRLSHVMGYGATGFISSAKIYAYELVAPSAGTELCLEKRLEARSYEPAALPITQITTTEYDAFGNPRLKTQEADLLPRVVIETEFANDTASWILGRVEAVKTTSGTRTLGWLDNVWVGNRLLEKREWLDTTGAWLATTLDYDANGNLSSVTAPQAADGLVRRTTTIWDATFRAYPERVTNAAGDITFSAYNADGLLRLFRDANDLETTTSYDVFGRKRLETRPDGGTTEYLYANFGDPSGYPNGQYVGTVTKLDAQGRTAFRREYFDGSGFTFQTVVTGDCPTGVFTEVVRDAAGRPSKTSLPHCELDAPAWTITTYEAMSRVETVTTPDGKVTRYGYEPSRRSVTDPNGRTTTRELDARERVVAIVDPANQTTRYAYDPLGRLVSVQLPNGEETTQAWDSLNRKTGSTVRLAASRPLLATTYTHDEVGNVRVVSAAGKTVGFTYDALNRVTRKEPLGEAAVAYAYGEPGVAYGRGRLTRRVDAAGTTTLGYRVNGQVASETRAIDGASFTQSFDYDLAARPTRVTFPDGSFADYTYSDGGAPATLAFNGAVVGTPGQIWWRWSEFTATGKPRRLEIGNGVRSLYGYDVMSHLTSLETGKGTDFVPAGWATTLQKLTYDWYTRPNTGGLNIGSIVDGRPGKLAPDGANTDETQTFTYDALDRLTAAAGVWGTKAYAYDAIGNASPFGGLVDRTLQYDGQQVVSGTGFSASYDDAGNMLHRVLDGTSWDYAWTVESRLASATKNGVLTAQMVYDGDGNRVKKIFFPATGPTVTTTYAGNAYEKRTFADGTPERHTLYLHANGQVVASITRAGNVATAFQNPLQWRTRWAQAQRYDGATPTGAVMRSAYVLAAVASHPLVVKWLPLAVFALLALAVLAVFARSVAAAAFERTVAFRLRLAALPLLVGFTLTACGGPADPRLGLQALISGDTTTGPPVGVWYYHRNHLNSSSVVTDASGVEATRLVYLPFGELSRANSSGTDVVTSKFTGQEYDAETGLYSYGARYYDPAIGRFVSADSIVPAITDAQAFNRYAYARDNPVLYTDPTGHSFWSAISGIFRSIANAIGSAMRGIWQAATWVANRYADAVKFWIRGQIFALQIARSMVVAATQNPMAALGIILAIAAGPPGWVGLAVAVAAQGMAMAAGVRDPQTLAIIGALSGAAAAGLTAMLMSGAKFGVEKALVAAGVPPAIATISAIAANMAVNALTSDPDAAAPGEKARLKGPKLADNSRPGASDTATDATAGGFTDAPLDPALLAQKTAEYKELGGDLTLATGFISPAHGLTGAAMLAVPGLGEAMAVGVGTALWMGEAVQFFAPQLAELDLTATWQPWNPPPAYGP